MSEIVIVALIGMTATLFAGPLTTAFDKHAERQLERERRRNARVELIGDKVRQLVDCRTALIHVATSPQSDEELKLVDYSRRIEEEGVWEASSKRLFYELKREGEQHKAWQTFADNSRVILLDMSFVIQGRELRRVFVTLRDEWNRCLREYEPGFGSHDFYIKVTGGLSEETEKLLHDFVPNVHAAIETDRQNAEASTSAHRRHRRAWRSVTSKFKGKSKSS